MLTQTAGYVFILIMAAIFIGVSYAGYRRVPITSVDQLVAGGRRTSLGIISASVLASWIWTTTIMGASEAGHLFGFLGGFHYAWGAVVPFLLFIPVALRIRRLMPRATTFTEFIDQRYGSTTHVLFLIFAIGLGLYVFTEQAIGAGILLNVTFGLPFKVGAVLTALIVTAYITLGGLRSSLLTDVVQFFIIAAAVLILVPAILIKVGGPGFIYDGLVRVATDPTNVNYAPWVLDWMAGAGWRYGLTAVVVALGQVLLDQGYYQRAVTAANNRVLKRAFILGTLFAWFPIPLVFGTVMGGTSLAMNLAEGNGLTSTTDLAPLLMNQLLGPAAGLLFATMVFMAAASTADTSLAGVQALFTADFFSRFLRRKRAGKNNNDERGQLRFGRMVTVLAGVACALIATLMEGASLLMVDIVAGILFAAPIGALVAGLFWRRTSPTAAILSMVLGLASGVTAWLTIPNDEINWFVGNVLSMTVPIVLVLVISLFVKDKFDFSRLRDWRPSYRVAVTDVDGQAE